MGWFFTKAALLTFGGAYAVLPYVYQGAVGHHGWLTPTQMIDGLALGGTTPGPLVERTRDHIRFTAPLTAITAAVVGVIVSLALFFGQHVLWPQGWGGPFDAVSALIALGAAVALMRSQRNVILVIGVCAVVGWGVKALG